MTARNLYSDFLESGLDKTGPEILDDITGQIRALNPVGYGLLQGSVLLSDLSTFGEGAEGLGRYIPGSDQSTSIDIPATLAGDGVYVRRPSSPVDLPKITVLADMPERLKNSTGRATLFNTVRYGAAVCSAVAQKASAPLRIVLSNDESFGTVLDSTARDSYIAMESIDNGTIDNPEESSPVNSVLANALEHINVTSNTGEDIVFVLSDFLDGYKSNEETFDWEESLDNLNSSFGDRLLVARLISPAQQQLPVGIAKYLPVSEIHKARRNFEQTAKIKAKRISRILGSMRHADINTAGEELIRTQLTDFITFKP